jgi:hypothetical protein
MSSSEDYKNYCNFQLSTFPADQLALLEKRLPTAGYRQREHLWPDCQIDQ